MRRDALEGLSVLDVYRNSCQPTQSKPKVGVISNTPSFKASAIYLPTYATYFAIPAEVKTQLSAVFRCVGVHWTRFVTSPWPSLCHFWLIHQYSHRDGCKGLVSVKFLACVPSPCAWVFVLSCSSILVQPFVRFRKSSKNVFYEIYPFDFSSLTGHSSIFSLTATPINPVGPRQDPFLH